MSYLQRNADVRADPNLLLTGVRSVVCVALSYKRIEEEPRASARTVDRPEKNPDAPGPPSTQRAPTHSPMRPMGRVATYAQGRDYHVTIRRMLEELAELMRTQLDAKFETRACVDTAPVLERELAHSAGIGWVGKNTMILSRELGSYTVLGELFTTLDLEPDTPATNRCGTCTACIDACPTRAIIEPHVLNASRCISYLTVEHRDAIDPEFYHAMGDWVFGCDICQQVCPFNRKAPDATHADMTADVVPPAVDLLSLTKLRSGEYRRLVAGSAANRARRDMWRRNATIALANVSPRDADTTACLEALRTDDSPLVQATANRLS